MFRLAPDIWTIGIFKFCQPSSLRAAANNFIQKLQVSAAFLRYEIHRVLLFGSYNFVLGWATSDGLLWNPGAGVSSVEDFIGLQLGRFLR